MYLCDDCTRPDDRIFLLKSYGPCESCGKVGTCNDVNIHWKTDKMENR